MPNGIRLWDEILRVTPEGSIIAGGAVRDWFLGYEPADIDVFCPNRAFVLEDPRFTRFNDELRMAQREEYEQINGIVDIRDYNFIDANLVRAAGYVVQFIFVDGPPALHVNQFDLGFTQCVYDGNLWFSRAANTDIENSTITQINHRNPERSRQRAERFIARHIGWRYVEQGQANMADPERGAIDPGHGAGEQPDWAVAPDPAYDAHGEPRRPLARMFFNPAPGVIQWARNDIET